MAEPVLFCQFHFRKRFIRPIRNKNRVVTKPPVTLSLVNYFSLANPLKLSFLAIHEKRNHRPEMCRPVGFILQLIEQLLNVLVE